MSQVEAQAKDDQYPPKNDPLAGLTEGRMVHYVMPNGKHRPAVIVRVWDRDHVNGCCNLSVFTDWTNDTPEYDLEGKQYILSEGAANGLMWQTSRLYSESKEPNTWHWIERA